MPKWVFSTKFKIPFGIVNWQKQIKKQFFKNQKLTYLSRQQDFLVMRCSHCGKFRLKRPDINVRYILVYYTVQYIYRVGIEKANFADFILDFQNCYSQSRRYIGFTC
jgi:hypothetical protein